MSSVSKFILKYKKSVTITFIVISVICGILQFGAQVNFNVVDYLPESAQSTRTLHIMEEEFTQSVPNARVMLSGVSVQEAIEYKDKLKEIDGISDVIWLDDMVNLKEPIEMADADTVESYYKKENAVISFTIREGDETAVCEDIYKLIGEDNYLAGDAVNLATAQEMSSSETTKAMVILIPFIIIILLLSTSSWLEPVLFLGAIGVSVLINMGLTVFTGEVSFVTKSVAPILQLAVSLDYAIFLLHSFEDYRKEIDDETQAMRMAMRRAFPTVAASAATTFFGFLALVFMEFQIGSDLGFNLVKGILLSFISVMVFLPALTLCCYKWIDKTKHKKFMPEFKRIGALVEKIKIPCVIAVFLLVIPAYLAQDKNDFNYGSSNLAPNSRSGQDTVKINEVFGESTAVVILVPAGDQARESEMCEALSNVDHVSEVIAYVTMVGASIPDGYLDETITSQFYSGKYARVILYTDTETEGEIAFSTVEAVQKTAEGYYPGEVLSCGQSVNMFDMKNVVTKDNSRVNIIAILAIGLVLLVTFRSLSLPFVLLMTIETSIWVNLSVPYFAGSSLNYIGYLVISTVQLGATVDYAILLTERYMSTRHRGTAKEVIKMTLEENFSSILVSTSILAVSGLCLALTSSNPLVAEMGMLLMRGTLLSFTLVIFFLPGILVPLDKLIEKTTFRGVRK